MTIMEPSFMRIVCSYLHLIALLASAFMLVMYVMHPETKFAAAGLNLWLTSVAFDYYEFKYRHNNE